MASKPTTQPNNPLFSSGPCTKRPGWTPSALADASLGRSHRSAEGKGKLVSFLAGNLAGRLSIPLVIVPGILSDEKIINIT